MASFKEILGLVCAKANVPEDCHWEEAQLMFDHFDNYLLLDEEGIIAIKHKHHSWLEVSFQEFEKYYSVFLLGVDPIVTYNEALYASPENYEEGSGDTSN